jgi:indolepyruvate ferredoxin oxidoreductase alpha subunit
MSALTANAAGKTELLFGNEAIARGALEAGVRVAASYPGTPASEILENLARVAEEAGLYAEWSVNEKVAAEVAVAASFAGLRAIVSFKHEGLNVALDTLCHVNLAGTKGGLAAGPARRRMIRDPLSSGLMCRCLSLLRLRRLRT